MIDALFEQVLALADEYTPRWSAPMGRRQDLVVSARNEIASFLPVFRDASDFNWEMQSFGAVGNISPVPGIRLFDPRYSPRTTDGFYIVWLFAGTGSAVYLTLNQGTSEFRSNKWRPIREANVVAARADAARASISEWTQRVVERGVAAIDLGASAMPLGPEAFQRIRNYEVGHIAGFEYAAGAVPDDDVLLDDLVSLLPVLAHLYEPTTTLVVNVSATTEVEAPPGRTSDAELNKAIEVHAMATVTAYYSGLGWECTDVSALRPYDLELTRGGEQRHVEVKGTTGPGTAVNLTLNEVRHAQEYPSCALAVLSGISVDFPNDGRPRADRGTLTVWDPWTIEHARLLATDYRYDLTDHPAARSG